AGARTSSEREEDAGDRREPPRAITPQGIGRLTFQPTQGGVLASFFEGLRVRNHATHRVDEGAHAAVGGAHEELTLFYGSELGERQVDPRLGAVAEPRVVR